MAIVPTLLGLVIAAVLFDYVQEKLGRRTASTFRAVYYLPQVLPVAVAGIVWGWILNPDRRAERMLRDVGLKRFTQDWLGNPHTALPSVMLVMVWLQIGYPVVMFMAGLQRVDPELHEAAELDGASWWQRFCATSACRSIRPEIFVVLLTRTIAALKVFGPIFVLTRGGPDNATMVPSYFAYQNFFEKAQRRLRRGDRHRADADHPGAHRGVHPGPEPRHPGRGVDEHRREHTARTTPGDALLIRHPRCDGRTGGAAPRGGLSCCAW